MRYALFFTILVLAAGCSNRPPKLVCIESIINPEYTAWLHSELNEIEEKDDNIL